MYYTIQNTHTWYPHVNTTFGLQFTDSENVNTDGRYMSPSIWFSSAIGRMNNNFASIYCFCSTVSNGSSKNCWIITHNINFTHFCCEKDIRHTYSSVFYYIVECENFVAKKKNKKSKQNLSQIIHYVTKCFFCTYMVLSKAVFFVGSHVNILIHFLV